MKTNKPTWSTEELNFINDVYPDWETWIFFFDCPVCWAEHTPTNIPDYIEEEEDLKIINIFECENCSTQFARVNPNEERWHIITLGPSCLPDEMWQDTGDYVI